MVLASWKMKKLVEVAAIIFSGYLLIQFIRLVFNASSGPMKFVHFGYSAWGRNIIEMAIVIFIVFSVIGAILKKD